MFALRVKRESQMQRRKLLLVSDAPLAYTIRKVAQMLGVSAATVRHWAEQGLLESYCTPGGQRRFSREQVDRFVEQLKRSARQDEQ
jgi:excisionase family DNA binding protein